MDEFTFVSHKHHFRINRSACTSIAYIYYCDICYYKCTVGRSYMWGILLYECDYDSKNTLTILHTRARMGNKPAIYLN